MKVISMVEVPPARWMPVGEFEACHTGRSGEYATVCNDGTVCLGATSSGVVWRVRRCSVSDAHGHGCG